MNARTMAWFGLTAALAGCVPMTPEEPALQAPNDASKWTIELPPSETNAAPTGPCRIDDEQHRLMLEGKLDSGRMDGTWTAYGSDGGHLATWSYRDGLRDGPFQLWYGYLRFPEAAGHLKMEGAFSEGRFSGPITGYYPTGARESLRLYDNGELKSSEYWSPDGSEASESAAQARAEENYKADMKFFGEYEHMVGRALAQARRQ